MNMNTSSTKLWNDQLPSQLMDVLLDITTRETLQNFLSDVMTDKEIREISARLEAARLLSEKVSYKEIAQKTKLSSRTIARISDWMQNGAGGYKTVITHHLHMSPARTE